MSKFAAGVICVLLVLFLGLTIFFSATPAGKAAWNNWFHEVQEADDKTNYETKKLVEDTCRAMISEYEADKLTWIQYKDSANDEERSWANQAKMRANTTASKYNNYVLQNNYVWEDNVPADIRMTLDFLE